MALLDDWREGAERFNAGKYWHAHESWERGWRQLPQPEKSYLQGLIQAAGAFHLASLGRPVPAARLARKAIEKLALEPEVRMPKPVAPGLSVWLNELALALEATPEKTALAAFLISFKGDVQVLE